MLGLCFKNLKEVTVSYLAMVHSNFTLIKSYSVSFRVGFFFPNSDVEDVA